MHACMLSRFNRVQLCNPMDYNLPGSSLYGILQARILEWIAILLVIILHVFTYAHTTHTTLTALSLYFVLLFSCEVVQLFAVPWTITCQAPLSMKFSKQEDCSGLPFPPQGIFLTQGLNLGLLHCRQTLYHLSHQGSPYDSIQLPIQYENLATVYFLFTCCGFCAIFSLFFFFFLPIIF